jgi:hypothetical protein
MKVMLQYLKKKKIERNENIICKQLLFGFIIENMYLFGVEIKALVYTNVVCNLLLIHNINVVCF